MTHQEYAASLRLIADFIEAHPEITLPYGEEFMNTALNTAEEAHALARAFGSFEKEYAEDLFIMKKQFGALAYRFVFYREQVCVKKVIGHEEIPERIIPAHTKEIVEWECLPVLAKRA